MGKLLAFDRTGGPSLARKTGGAPAAEEKQVVETPDQKPVSLVSTANKPL